LLKKPCAYLSFFCIHVFNFRSSLRKSLFKRSSIQFLTRERQLVIVRTERGIGYVSVRLTNRRKRARGSFFSLTRKPTASLCASFLMGHMVLCSKLLNYFSVEDRFQFFSQRIQQLGETKTFLHFVHFFNFYLLKFRPIFDHSSRMFRNAVKILELIK